MSVQGISTLDLRAGPETVESVSTAAKAVRFGILGPLFVRGEARTIDLGAAKLRSLLAVFLLEPNRAIVPDRLIDALWGERPPASAAGTLHTYVSKLRKALGSDLIQRRSAGYVFVIEDVDSIDVHRFERLAREGIAALEAGDPEQAAAVLASAGSLWRGPALADLALDDFAQPEITRLKEARLLAEERRIEAELMLGRHAEVAPTLARLVSEYPLREGLWAHRIVALYRCGRQAEALRSYGELRSYLAEELGIQPSLRLQRLEDAVLLQKPELDWRPSQHAAGSARNIPADPSESHQTRPPFVGRREELRDILSEPVTPRVRVVLVGAVAGGGKSRLLAEGAIRASGPVVRGGASRPQQHEPWSLARVLLANAIAVRPDSVEALPEYALQALAGVVPNQVGRTPQSSAIDPESRRAVAMHAAVQLLAAGADGGLLLVDDAQWADSTSLALLGSIARLETALTLVVAYRSEELRPGSALRALLHEFDALPDEPIDITLGPLSPDEIAELFADDRLVEAVSVQGDGTPLALAEVWRGLFEAKAITVEGDGRWGGARPDTNDLASELAAAGQYRSIRARINSLPTGRKQTLEVLAILGRAAPWRVVADARGDDASSVLGDLEALAKAGLVQPGASGWSIDHDVVQEVIIDSLDRATRTRLHQLLARTLQADGGDPAEVAAHLVGAGDQRAAAQCYEQAARQRLSDFAGAEAESLAEAGLHLDSTPRVHTRLTEVRAAARELLGNLRGARADLRLVLRRMTPGPSRARVLAHAALLTTGEDPREALDMVEVALTQAGSDLRAQAEALAVAAIVDGNVNRIDRAAVRSAAALELFRQLGDAHGVATALDATANASLYEGHIVEAARNLEFVARQYRHAGSLRRVGTPLSLAGWCLMLSGRASEGLVRVEEALELERMLGQREGEAACLWVLSEVLLGLGRVEEAAEAGEQALALNLQVENRPGTVMSLCALAMATAAAGEAPRAIALLRQAVERGPGLMEHGLAGGRLATVAMATGDLVGAQAGVQLCLAATTPLARYEGLLVAAELAIAAGEADAVERATDLLVALEAEGYSTSAAVTRLRRLLLRPPAPSPV